MATLPERIAREMPFARKEIVVDGVRLSVVDDGPSSSSSSSFDPAVRPPPPSAVRPPPPSAVRPPPSALPGTILFVHGNPTWSYLWRSLMGPAKAAGHRVVAPDHAGFGLSDKPTKGEYYTLERHVANLVAIVRELDLRDITLVIHDWGGPIGMGLATAEPDRIARICVCNTVAFAPKETRALTKWHAWLSTPWGYRAGVWLNVVERSAMKLGVVKPLPRHVRRAYDWPMRARGGRVAAARFVQMVPDGPDHPSARTLAGFVANYPKLTAKPMLVLWADKDRVMRARFAERWLDDFPDAKVLHVAPDAGHFWQEDAPELFLPHILAFAAGETS